MNEIDSLFHNRNSAEDTMNIIYLIYKIKKYKYSIYKLMYIYVYYTLIRRLKRGIRVYKK